MTFTVRVSDLALVGYCRSGSRKWAEMHGLSWQSFLTDGISSDTLAGLNDGLADRLLAEITARKDMVAWERADRVRATTTPQAALDTTSQCSPVSAVDPLTKSS